MGKTTRRQVLKYGALAVGLSAVPSFGKLRGSSHFRFLRPPGALDEGDFVRKCIRCGLCGDVCPNQCVSYFDLGEGERSGTPFIVPRDQGCVLCMKCTQVCPSGALTPISDDRDVIQEEVKMGTAVIDENLCYSYNNRICGVCYRACPFQGEALTIGAWERPTVVAESCVGCGLCERICYHYPQAIRVIPKHEERG